MSSPPFGLVPAGQPLITMPTEEPSPTSRLYAIPPSPSNPGKPVAHVAVFMLPGIELPAGTAAAIYLVTPPPAGSSTPGSKFLGGIGPGKESSIFRLSAPPAVAGPGSASKSGSAGAAENTVIGISVEDAASVAARIEEIKNSATSGSTSKALVPAGAAGQATTLVLAQRIVGNAFNYLASFSGQGQEGQGEVVPLKAFKDWWQKFEGRVRSDPSFLEREQ